MKSGKGIRIGKMKDELNIERKIKDEFIVDIVDNVGEN